MRKIESRKAPCITPLTAKMKELTLTRISMIFERKRYEKSEDFYEGTCVIARNKEKSN